MVVGFPSNQFGMSVQGSYFLTLCLANQEPGTNEEIQQFCQLNFGVTFPVLSKIEVNGDNADPVFKYLKKNKSGLLGISRIKYCNPI
jgi:peroxiredoxin